MILIKHFLPVLGWPWPWEVCLCGALLFLDPNSNFGPWPLILPAPPQISSFLYSGAWTCWHPLSNPIKSSELGWLVRVLSLNLFFFFFQFEFAKQAVPKSKWMALFWWHGRHQAGQSECYLRVWDMVDPGECGQGLCGCPFVQKMVTPMKWKWICGTFLAVNPDSFKELKRSGFEYLERFIFVISNVWYYPFQRHHW